MIVDPDQRHDQAVQRPCRRSSVSEDSGLSSGECALQIVKARSE